MRGSDERGRERKRGYFIVEMEEMEAMAVKRSLCPDPMGRNKLPGPRERKVKASYSRFGSPADCILVT